jgi:hypothetical protein
MKVLRLTLLTALAAAYSTAGIITYDASLSGANEAPPSGSPGIGFAIVTVDTILNTMEVNVTFSGLEAGNTAAHIHCCIAPGGNTIVATVTPTFTGFPSGTTSGTYDHTFDMTLASSYNAAFVTANGGTAGSAEAALFAGLAAGNAYLNIHTPIFPGGEVRGFLVATPEPGTWLLVLAGIGAILLAKRKLAV